MSNHFSAENTREHLANERTFLAWVRTTLALVGLGFVVVKFSPVVTDAQKIIKSVPSSQHSIDYSLPLGILLIAISGICILAAYGRYKTVQKNINLNRFEHKDVMVNLLAASIIILCVLLIIYLVSTN